MTTHKVYFCTKCNAAVKDEIKCLVCGRTQLEIGWIEINKKGEQ